MHIPIPRWLVKGWFVFGRWGNVPVRRIGRFEILRLDLLLVLGGILTAAYYGMVNGPLGALAGAAAYAMFLALALVFRR